MTPLKAIARAYLKSWVFLIWSAVCVCIGAGWMYLAIVAALEVNGVRL